MVQFGGLGTLRKSCIMVSIQIDKYDSMKKVLVTVDIIVLFFQIHILEKMHAAVAENRGMLSHMWT